MKTNKLEIRTLTLEEITVEVTAMNDDFDTFNVETAEGKLDEEYLRKAVHEHERGNPWPWSMVVVKVQWNGFDGHDMLCGSAYASEEEFRKTEEFEDMKKRALEALNANVSSVAQRISEVLVT